MISATIFREKRVAVIGLGGSGLAACCSLSAGGADVIAWDDNEKVRKYAALNGFRIGDPKRLDFRKLDALVLSPGIPLTYPKPHWSVHLARSANIEIIGDVEIFARQREFESTRSQLIYVTGTNGKSTTTALIAHVLQMSGYNIQVGGNIGVPILNLEPPSSRCVYVIELSSFNINLMSTLNSSIGILLNISPDHLDRHGSFKNYIDLKALIPKNSDYAIIGTDDIPTLELYTAEKARRSALSAISNGLVRQGVGVRNRAVTRCTHDKSSPGIVNFETIVDLTNSISLRGRHNAQNASAATAACLHLGLTTNQIALGMKTFVGLPHRMEKVGQINRVIFINDSKATNAVSAAHSLEAFHANIYWIVGGQPKVDGIAPLAAYFSKISSLFADQSNLNTGDAHHLTARL